ncbi:unnamed protein product [Rotaria sp. Silwood2]|nr:unnamed protein product [Rotaria sp. Silwood2]CAF4666070.1 unnamed protein product [Rotaria sp. Silwood2]
MQFTGSSSYFQAYGFYQAGYGVVYNKPFSISMWISASSYSSCAFVQMSIYYYSTSCVNMLGIWSSTGNAAQLVAQGYGWINWLQIGYNFGCSGNYISNGAFQGIIDEIYVHNREITATEVYALANP